MTTFSRREMFSGTAAMLGAACLAPGNTSLAEGSEYMFAPGLNRRSGLGLYHPAESNLGSTFAFAMTEGVE